ncbi:MAG: hypothetical protein EP315_00300 [Gammaproteobacteria bacterium]|nr:MAG: hypothetical protein EP315_00300 [Gammaproteobacteria bacterium]
MTRTIKFSINNWQHLYSLEQAIRQAQQVSGNHLSIEGTLRNEPLFNQQDIHIKIDFQQVRDTPDYATGPHGQIILGEMLYSGDTLSCSMPIDENVFSELRKNLVEYAGIDGIHIVVTMGLLLDTPIWPIDTSRPVVQLDYAMRGDA